MLQKNRVSSTKIHLQINTSVDKINYGNSDRNNWISLGKREKYSHDPCAVSWGDSLIPMHLQYVQAINMSNTFHMFTITKSCPWKIFDENFNASLSWAPARAWRCGAGGPQAGHSQLCLARQTESFASFSPVLCVSQACLSSSSRVS